MAKTAEELFKDMAKKAGYTEEQVKLALDQPEWKDLQNGYVRHDEYSSALDKAKNLEGKAKKAEDWDKWYKDNGPAIQGLNEKAQLLAKYEERFGALDGSDPNAPGRAIAAGMSQADVTKLILAAQEQQSQNFSGLLKDTMYVTSRHASEFGEALSMEQIGQLEKIAIEKRVPLTQAYEELVAPRVRERETKKTEETIQKRVDERVKDELSRRSAGPGSRGSDIPPSFIIKPAGADAPKDLTDQDLQNLWAEAGKEATAA